MTKWLTDRQPQTLYWTVFRIEHLHLMWVHPADVGQDGQKRVPFPEQKVRCISLNTPTVSLWDKRGQHFSSFTTHLTTRLEDTIEKKSFRAKTAKTFRFLFVAPFSVCSILAKILLTTLHLGNYLSDPGVPGVRSMGPDVSKWVDLLLTYLMWLWLMRIATQC